VISLFEFQTIFDTQDITRHSATAPTGSFKFAQFKESKQSWNSIFERCAVVFLTEMKAYWHIRVRGGRILLSDDTGSRADICGRSGSGALEFGFHMDSLVYTGAVGYMCIHFRLAPNLPERCCSSVSVISDLYSSWWFHKACRCSTSSVIGWRAVRFSTTNNKSPPFVHDSEVGHTSTRVHCANNCKYHTNVNFGVLPHLPRCSVIN